MVQEVVRKDFLIERYSIISEKRGKRPHQFKEAKLEKVPERDPKCFFCPGNEHMTPPEIMSEERAGKWHIRAFENKFPALAEPDGRHEIIVETRKHDKQLHGLTPKKIQKVFMFADARRQELEKKHRYVAMIKNCGREGGASVLHSHMQIIALPMVPTIVAEEDGVARAYYRKNKSNPYLDMLDEIPRRRVVLKNKYVMAVTPNAPRYPYEVWLFPRREVENFSALDHAEQIKLATGLKKLLQKASRMKEAYNFYQHYAPAGHGKWFQYHIEILPRLSNWAGLELGAGVYICTTSPETAAKYYRSK